MSEPWAVAVVGAGIVGLSTAYALTQRGVEVSVYESGVPGNGQSGGESRIFRHAHDDPRLVALARTSRSLWDKWAQRLGTELVSSDGVVAIGPSVQDRVRLLTSAGLPARLIQEAELSERLPLLTTYSGPAMLDQDGGAIRTGAAINALVNSLGESLLTDEVISIRPTAHGTVEVMAGGARKEYSNVVVCAGRGTPPLARQLGLSIPVSLAAHVRATFPVVGIAPERLACFQDSSGDFGESGVYAAPVPGNDGYAVGLSESVGARDDGTLIDPRALSVLADHTRAYVTRALPGLEPKPREFRHCWVTHLPWSTDGVAVWERDAAFFVVGHNLFKLAPALGSALAEAIVDGGLPRDLRPEAKLGEPQ